MSFIRASEKMCYSDYDGSLYAFLSGKGEDKEIESYGDINDPEAFCEIMFRVLDQAGAEVDLETVNKARDRLGLDPLEEIDCEYKISEEFKERMERLEEEYKNG